MKKLLLCISALVFLIQGTTKAQLVDVFHEAVGVGPQPDPFFGNPMPAGYTAYRIYVRLQDPTDRLSAVFGSSLPSPVHSLHLWSSAGANSIFNNSGGGFAGETPNCALFAFSPALQYDSWVTIGQASNCVDCVGLESGIFQITSPPNQINTSFAGGALGPDLSITDGSWFLPNDGSCNGFGQAPDNRILIAQMTVPTGTLEYWLNVAVFDEAIGAQQHIYVHTMEGPTGLVGSIVEEDFTCFGLVFPEPPACADVIGCMDVAACNYDPLATIDSGLCTYPGCDDPLAYNFDPAAGCSDGSCLYEPCCDATGYDDLAGACATSVCGYDPFCCNTAWDGICAGEAATDANCAYCLCETYGCMDVAACNYDPAATVDDLSCTYPGCDDPLAYNYNPAAGCNDGSCLYQPCCDETGYDDLTGACATSVCGYDPFCCSNSWDSICAGEAATDANCTYCICAVGCTDPLANNYDAGAIVDDGSCEYGCCNQTGYLYLTGACATSVCGYDPFCCNTSWDSICAGEAATDANCTYCNCALVPGCTDPLANNFDPAATTNDGSCEYGCCSDPGYIYLAGPCATSVCGYDPFCCSNSWDSICAGEAATDANCAYCVCNVLGCTDPAANNYNPAADTNDGSCEYGCCNQPGYLYLTGACATSVCAIDPFCCNTSWDSICAGEAAVDANCAYCTCISGCTNAAACNYNPAATIDDGSCTFPGCNNPVACNYDPAAGCDDGSCIIAPANDVCAGAIFVGGDGSFGDDNTNSCVDGPQPTCGFGPGPDVWYSFTYNGGTVVINTVLGSMGDSRLTVYDACGGAVVACNDDFSGLASQVSLGCGGGFIALTVGTTYYVQVSGYNGSLGSFTLNFNFENIVGCCDPLASNYNACANDCSGVCDYFGCTNPAACNFNPAATTDDGSCCLENCITLDITAGSFPGEISWDINGNAGGAPFNGMLCLPTGCLAFNMVDSWGDGWNGAVYTFYDQLGNVIATGTAGGFGETHFIAIGGGNGCTDPAACNYDAGAVCDDASCTYPGCNDIAACNYNAAAGCNDGSCTYPGCNDPAACNYNALAGCNDGSCTYPGCTDPTACNYNAAAGCDDGSCIPSGCIDPLACNYDPAAGCSDGSCVYPPCIANDVPAGAIALAVTPLGVCNPMMDDLTGASDSPESIVVGPDLWYSFTALTSGIRIEAADLSPQNLAIEILDAGLNPVDMENVVGGNGAEALNIGSLTAGNQYYISVSNAGGGGAPSTFTICVQWLPDTRCDYGPGPYSLCSTFKADWVGANAYAFHFTSQTTFLTYDKTQMSPTPGTFCVLNTVPGLGWGDSYDVVIGAVWNLNDGNGGVEAIEVMGDEPCSITINPQPLMTLRPSDNCANHGPHFIGNTVAGQPFVCGAVDYEWTFVRTDVPELPIVHLRGAANRFLNLNTVPGLTPGGTYDVSMRPIFATASSVYGAVSCISIVGPVLMTADNNGATVEHSPLAKVAEEVLEVGLYPNPNNGELINVNLTNIESDIVKIEMFDMFGKMVYSKQFAVSGVLNTIISFEEPLAGGVYMVNITMNGDTSTERLVVNR